MKNFWHITSTFFGVCFSLCVASFMVLPSVSEWKKVAGIACAITGTIFFISMFFARRPDRVEEVHLANREFNNHYGHQLNDIDHPD